MVYYRRKHVNAITWLNESSAAAFYLPKIEGIKIGEFPPAPLLTLIVGPSEESKELGGTKKELAERDSIRERFWVQLLDKAREKTKLHADVRQTLGSLVCTPSDGGNSVAFPVRIIATA
jgi:hypothetical protein